MGIIIINVSYEATLFDRSLPEKLCKYFDTDPQVGYTRFFQSLGKVQVNHEEWNPTRQFLSQPALWKPWISHSRVHKSPLIFLMEKPRQVEMYKIEDKVLELFEVTKWHYKSHAPNPLPDLCRNVKRIVEGLKVKAKCLATVTGIRRIIYGSKPSHN